MKSIKSVTDIQSSLEGIVYPATKNDLVEQARSNSADDEIVTMLESLPDKEYDGPDDISREMAQR